MLIVRVTSASNYAGLYNLVIEEFESTKELSSLTVINK